MAKSKKKQEGVGMWVAIVVLFVLGAWPIALILLLPPLLRRRLYRWQGAACLALYLLYVAAALLAPLAGA